MKETTWTSQIGLFFKNKKNRNACFMWLYTRINIIICNLGGNPPVHVKPRIYVKLIK